MTDQPKGSELHKKRKKPRVKPFTQAEQQAFGAAVIQPPNEILSPPKQQITNVFFKFTSREYCRAKRHNGRCVRLADGSRGELHQILNNDVPLDSCLPTRHVCATHYSWLQHRDYTTRVSSYDWLRRCLCDWNSHEDISVTCVSLVLFNMQGICMSYKFGTFFWKCLDWKFWQK